MSDERNLRQPRGLIDSGPKWVSTVVYWVSGLALAGVIVAAIVERVS